MYYCYIIFLNSDKEMLHLHEHMYRLAQYFDFNSHKKCCICLKKDVLHFKNESNKPYVYRC